MSERIKDVTVARELLHDKFRNPRSPVDAIREVVVKENVDRHVAREVFANMLAMKEVKYASPNRVKLRD